MAATVLSVEAVRQKLQEGDLVGEVTDKCQHDIREISCNTVMERPAASPATKVTGRGERGYLMMTV
jgi:hypothetical protein